MVLFILSLLPIIWLVIGLCVLKMPSYKASIITLLIAMLEGLFIWKAPVINVLTAALEGFVMALWPIVIVIIAAIFTYNITVKTGAMETIKTLLCSISDDSRVLALLLAWGFGGFMEGMAGFGTAVAIPVGMLITLGFDPILAVVICLVANGCPTMFGSVAVPTTTLASLVNIDVMSLSFTSALMAAPLYFITPFIVVSLVSKSFKKSLDILPVTLASSLGFIVPVILFAKLVGPELCDIIAALISMGLTIWAAKTFKKKETAKEYKLSLSITKIDTKTAMIAVCPFVLIFVVLLLTSNFFPFIHDSLSSVKTVLNIYKGDPNAKLTLTWINTPGVLILFCGIVGGFVQKLNVKEMLDIFVSTVKQMSKTIITMLAVLGSAKVMGYTGMIASMASFFVASLGTYYPLVAPLLGAIGTFVTGSGTSSEVLFGNVQVSAAEALNINKVWLAASNSLGTATGKMLSPQTIAIGTAACGKEGEDGLVLSKVIPIALIYIVLSALIVYFGKGIM
ncbi:MAG: L-lactate permease [Erysipelotrichaceae bacterium]|nr:L-lactate permease [Erysipelotrichaceae bacterium]